MKSMITIPPSNYTKALQKNKQYFYNYSVYENK